MEILRRETDYALRALHVLNTRGECTDTMDLARECRVPLPALRKIMQTLAKAGVVKTVRGAMGGYLLAGPVRNISPYSGQGPMKGSVCILQDRLNALFKKTTLAEIYKPPKKKRRKS